MKNTLKVINQLLHNGIIKKYAIAGGMAQFYYIEPSATYDLDLVVQIKGEENSLHPLEELYGWAKKNNYKIDREHILIEGIPVQFLLAYNGLLHEALCNALEITIFDEPSSIFGAEYLMAIMLQTGRSIDRERFIRFINEADYDKIFLESLVKKFNLEVMYRKLIDD